MEKCTNDDVITMRENEREKMEKPSGMKIKK
jgi:hypothetical protein